MNKGFHTLKRFDHANIYHYILGVLDLYLPLLNLPIIKFLILQ